VPAPAFEWKEIEVPADLDRGRLGLAAAAAPADTVTVPIPDLSAFPSPLDKARILLESAAEIEHMLMVQYLYAAYSLKTADEVTDSGLKAALSDRSETAWPQVLFAIAREEMGHLMTVQNLLLLLGLKPNFEREDYPPHKDIYPFKLHLEPLTQRSLAKYVVAEAATDAEGIDEIVNIATDKAGGPINRVGALYGLLGVVFATAADIDSGASGDADWDAIVRRFAAAAHKDAPPEKWHLGDEDFHPQSLSQQANPEDWQVSHLRVHRAADRAAAIQPIRDIGEQGEGPTTADELSHFARFFAVFKGGAGLPPFPEAPPPPTRDVPTDPKVEDIANERTKRWAELADIRYALLLGFLEHYLLGDADERHVLTGWIFAEMRSRIGFIARELTAMPRAEGAGAAGVAAIPFTLPADLHLPSDRSARWEVHRRRTETAIEKVEQMRSDAADAENPYLAALLESDQARLDLMTHPPTGPAPTSFKRDIRPLFRPKDVRHMKNLVGSRMVDLGSLDGASGVREKAELIKTRVESPSPGSQMPKPPDPHWTKAQIELFKRWMAENFPP
jgi:Ferritin-like